MTVAAPSKNNSSNTEQQMKKRLKKRTAIRTTVTTMIKTLTHYLIQQKSIFKKKFNILTFIIGKSNCNSLRS